MRVCARAMPAPTAPTAPRTGQLPPLYLGNPYLNPHLRSFQDELLDAARKDGGGGGGGGGVSEAELAALQAANDAEHAAMKSAWIHSTNAWRNSKHQTTNSRTRTTIS